MRNLSTGLLFVIIILVAGIELGICDGPTPSATPPPAAQPPSPAPVTPPATPAPAPPLTSQPPTATPPAVSEFKYLPIL